MNADTAAAEPADEPPGERPVSCGFKVRDGLSSASSVVTVLPRMIAPAARNAATQSASALGWRPVQWTAVLGRHVGGIDDVLDADRHALERSKRPSRCNPLIRLSRGRECFFAIDVLPCANSCIIGSDEIETRAHDSNARNSPARRAAAASVAVNRVGSVAASMRLLHLCYGSSRIEDGQAPASRGAAAGNTPDFVSAALQQAFMPHPTILLWA